LYQGCTSQAFFPKRGRHNKEDKERESSQTFKKLRKAHSAVESNINMPDNDADKYFILHTASSLFLMKGI
jgi:hypothetical protein